MSDLAIGHMAKRLSSAGTFKELLGLLCLGAFVFILLLQTAKLALGGGGSYGAVRFWVTYPFIALVLVAGRIAGTARQKIRKLLSNFVADIPSDFELVCKEAARCGDMATMRSAIKYMQSQRLMIGLAGYFIALSLFLMASL